MKRDQYYRDQPSLFGDAHREIDDDGNVTSKPLARTLTRTSHPSTSHEAGMNKLNSESFGADELLTIRTLKDHPYSTSKELERFAGCKPGKIHRRLDGLRKKGKVTNGDARECREGHNKCQTWVLVG